MLGDLADKADQIRIGFGQGEGIRISSSASGP